MTVTPRGDAADVLPPFHSREGRETLPDGLRRQTAVVRDGESPRACCAGCAARLSGERYTPKRAPSCVTSNSIPSEPGLADVAP